MTSHCDRTQRSTEDQNPISSPSAVSDTRFTPSPLLWLLKAMISHKLSIALLNLQIPGFARVFFFFFLSHLIYSFGIRSLTGCFLEDSVWTHLWCPSLSSLTGQFMIRLQGFLPLVVKPVLEMHLSFPKRWFSMGNRSDSVLSCFMPKRISCSAADFCIPLYFSIIFLLGI